MPDQVRFTETMRGRLAAVSGSASQLDRESCLHAAAGPASDALFTLTVVTPDVDEMVGDPLHRSPAFGCVLAPSLHRHPIAVERGCLDLFVDAEPGVLHMRYRLDLRTESGERRTLRGVKIVSRRRFWPTVLTDTTTLFVEVHDEAGVPTHRGVLWMGPLGVLAQGLTFRGAGAWLGLAGIVRFMRYYVARCVGVYFGPQRAP